MNYAWTLNRNQHVGGSSPLAGSIF